MKFEVNIDKKYFFILLGAILVLAGAIYTNAYGGSEPEIMGHTWEELGEVPEQATRWAKASEIDWSQQILGAIRMDFSSAYDVWLQGGESTSAGDDRNLALLGLKTYDRLHINHAEEYDGNDGATESVRIYGDTRILGDLDVDGEIIGGVQACRTCFRAAGSGSWGDWGCTPYAYPGGGQETSPVIGGGDTGSGWTFQIKMECI